jgi:hypothetical protein
LLTGCSGTTGSKLEVEEISGAYHKRFRTLAQAEAFIEDWKESFANLLWRVIREGLDQGLRPCNMKLSVGILLHGADGQTEGADVSDEVKLDKLSLNEE